MNVLHIDEQRGWRGGEQQASYLIQGLAARGHAQFLAGRGNTPFQCRGHGAGVTAISCPFLNELDPFTVRKLANFVRRQKIDILHAHTSHTHTLACLACALAGRGAVVVSRRVDFPPKNNPFNRWKYRQPHAIIAISDYIAGVLRKFGVEEGRLHTVHSAIDPSRFDVEPVERAALGVPDGAPLIGNVAALVGHKDHTTLIAAMPSVLAKIPEAILLIAGEGPLRADLESQIRDMGINASVRLLGQRGDVPRLLRALDVFVLSSREEGLGTSVLDAMACEIPVAATAAGGIPEMVINEETGLLTPPRDPQALAQAITRLLRDREHARALAAQGRARVLEKFTADRMVEGNLRVYEAVLARARS